MTLDLLLPNTWDSSVVDSLDRWRQGHLIAMEKGTWIAPGGVADPVTGDPMAAGGPVGDLRARSAPFGNTGYMALVSQTCDVAGGPGLRHPLIQTCPVRDVSAFPREKIQQIRDGHVVEYVYLSRPPVADATWAVDLRAVVPVSKGVLVGTDPVEGFASIEDELLLGHRLAGKLARPAIHDALTGPVFNSVRKFISRNKRTQSWCDDIEQVRLEILDGSGMYPKRVRLLVLTDCDFGPLERRPLRDEWKSHKRVLQQAGITWAPIGFVAVDKCSIRRYRAAVPIDIPTLDRGRFD